MIMKQNRDKSNVLRLFKLILKLYKYHILIVLVCIVISSLATLASTLFTRTLIDDYISPMVSSTSISSFLGNVGLGPDYSPLAKALLRLALALAVGVGASYTFNVIMIYVGQGTMFKLRHNVFQHMESLPLKYFDTHPHGDIMSVYTNDIDTLRQVIGQSIPRLFQSIVTIVSTFISMIILSIPLSLLSIILAFIMYVVTKKLGKLSKKYFTQRQKKLAALNGYIEEMIEGQRVIKVFSREEKAKELFSEKNEDLRKSVFNANKVANIVMPINGNISNLGYVLIAIVGAIIALSNKDFWILNGINGAALSLGSLVAFLTLHKNFSRPVSQISSEVNSIIMASAGADRVYDVLDQISEEDNGMVELIKEENNKWAWSDGRVKKSLQGEVSLQNVDFSYTAGKQILFDINLIAYPGQKIAFVGGTGAGKTTITNLINRFYEIEDGVILYDGFNIKNIKKDSLRKSLGIVLQETQLFSGTVLDNIRYGREDATEQECIEAAKLVYAHSFISRLPQGYHTVLDSSGGNLSQGERQLLSIARAAVAAPPVLILDEATSSIDTRTERMIQLGMDSLMKGRTTFVIAHRLSTIQNADYIMVLDRGRIIERGKHNELLEQRGKYYELFTGNQIVS